MKSLTIISKNYGTQKIWIDSFDSNKASKLSTIYKVVEHIFNDWYSHASAGQPDVVGCYNGWGEDEPALYSKVGAIRQGIGDLIDYAIENKLSVMTTKQIQNIDLEATFQI